MAFLPAIGELVIGGLESGEATNIVAGAETAMSQFKNEVIKGSVFGTLEGLAFTGATSLYNDITGNSDKNKKSKDNSPIKKGRKPKRCH